MSSLDLVRGRSQNIELAHAVIGITGCKPTRLRKMGERNACVVVDVSGRSVAMTDPSSARSRWVWGFGGLVLAWLLGLGVAELGIV